MKKIARLIVLLFAAAGVLAIVPSVGNAGD